jgi:hypothetical protein
MERVDIDPWIYLTVDKSDHGVFDLEKSKNVTAGHLRGWIYRARRVPDGVDFVTSDADGNVLGYHDPIYPGERYTVTRKCAFRLLFSPKQASKRVPANVFPERDPYSQILWYMKFLKTY